MNEIAIEVKNLVKNFSLEKDTINVLKKINLTVRKKDFITIMGPSGSGKSTLLYLLGGLDRPTKGEITLLGQDITNMKDSLESAMRRKDIGFIFQFYNLIPNLNVEENILLPVLLDNKKAKDYQSKLNQILDLVGLSNKRHHVPAQLSGGQQQRVAIARALINDPQIILADEPTGNLDSKTGNEVLELLRSINQKKGISIIMVTHAKEAALFGNRIINLKDGEIEREEYIGDGNTVAFV